ASPTVAGNVYYDPNNNGVEDPGEPGIAGAIVTLTGTNDLGQAIGIAQATNQFGQYAFLSLRPGVYNLAETQPGAYLDGKDTLGSPGGVMTNDQFSSIVLGVNVHGINYKFGEILPAAVKGYVYYDANNDGVKQGNELGIGGVTVTLTGT